MLAAVMESQRLNYTLLPRLPETLVQGKQKGLSSREAKGCKLIYNKPELGVCIAQLPPRLLEFSKDMNFVGKSRHKSYGLLNGQGLDWREDKEQGPPN